MDIFTFLNNKPKIATFSEADDIFEDNNSFEDFGTPSNNNMDFDIGNQGMSFDQGFGDTNDGFGSIDQNKNTVSSMITNYLESLDEDEQPFVEKILNSFGSFYNERKREYERLLLLNMDSTTNGEDIAKLRTQYKLTIEILREYIMNKCLKDTTYARTIALIEFKEIFTKLNDSFNTLLDDIK